MKPTKAPTADETLDQTTSDQALAGDSPPATIADAIGWHAAGSVLSVVVTPRSGVSTANGVEAGCLRVRLAAPPVNGAANKALVRFLAELARVAPSRVRIVAGASGRRKRVLFARVTMNELAERLKAVT